MPPPSPGDAVVPVASATRWTTEQVLSVRAWTDRLLSLRTTRDAAFRYTPGLYARLGLVTPDGDAVWRAFSMVSAPHEAALEFVATLVEEGVFSGRLARLAAGDPMRIDAAAYGFLTLSALAPGRSLWLLASGTGIGPFVSMLRDPKARASFETIVVVHSVRHAAELAYRDEVRALVEAGGSAARLVYLATVTREAAPGAFGERIPALLADGRLEAAAGATLDVGTARVMGCGNPDLVVELRRVLQARGFATGRRGMRGTMAFERYW